MHNYRLFVNLWNHEMELGCDQEYIHCFKTFLHMLVLIEMVELYILAFCLELSFKCESWHYISSFIKI